MNKRLRAVLAFSGAACILVVLVGFILAPRLLAEIFAYCESPLSHCPMHPQPATIYIIGHVPWFLSVGCVLLLVASASLCIASLRQSSQQTSEN